MPRVPRMAIRIGWQSGLGDLSAGPHLDKLLTRSWLTHGLVTEPGGNLFGSYHSLFLNQSTLGHDAFPIFGQKPESFERAMFAYQAATHHSQIAHGYGEPVLPVQLT